jgi:hypothetical protein
MRRYAAVALLLAGLSGCFNLDTGPDTGWQRPLHAQGMGPPSVPGVQGPYGLPVPMKAPYSYNPPPNLFAAQQMMRESVPLGMVQPNGPGSAPGNMPAPFMPGGTLLSPPGMPGMPGGAPGGLSNPTTAQMLSPGPGSGSMPGGNMPGNMPGGSMPGGGPSGDIQLAQFMMNPAAATVPQPGQRTQVRFLRPIGMQVSWYAQGPDGAPMYSPTPIETPGKYNFLQGSRYRLKLTNIPGRPGLELYPTLEVVQANHKVEAFLAHSSVPVEFTDEDFKQVAEGNYIIKVIYLPDPQFQDVAGTGTDEIISTRLEPGQDPIQEAMRRGSILLIIRMGNIDQEAPNTPPLSQPAPPHGAAGAGANPKPGPTMPGILTSPLQVPYWGLGPTKGPLPPPYPAPMPPPPGMPPGMMPPGMMPPGMMPPGVPGNGQPGNVPPGQVPPGSVPPGNVPPGNVPPGGGPPSFLPPGNATGFPGAMPPAGPGLPNTGPAGPPSVPPFGPSPTPGSAPFFPNLLPSGPTAPSAPSTPPSGKGASAPPSTPSPVTPVSASTSAPARPPLLSDPAPVPPRAPLVPEMPRP